MRIRSAVAWVVGKYAMHCDNMLVYSVYLNKCLNMNCMATSLTLNIKKYCYSYLNGLVDLWCLRGRCLPIQVLWVFGRFRDTIHRGLS